MLRDGRYESAGVSYDVENDWLVVHRGAVHVVCNVATRAQDVPLGHARNVMLASTTDARFGPCVVTLPPERPTGGEPDEA